MASIKWHDTAEKASVNSARISGGNIWAIVTIVLVGVIVGFLFASRPEKNSVTSVPASDARVIAVSVDNWKFTPNIISLKQNENVILELTGKNGVHGLAVPGLRINEQILPGQTIRVTIPTDKTGSFDFFCSIACGPGHADMEGKIMIE